MSTLEEQALHTAALAFARTRFQSLETRMRVDRALTILSYVPAYESSDDRVSIATDDFETIIDLARLTVLHAGQKDYGIPRTAFRQTGTESLLVEAVKTVRQAQEHFGSTESGVNAALAAFGELIALLSTCSRMPGDPPCARDGACPEHGKNRPGQCVVSFTDPNHRENYLQEVQDRKDA